MCIRDRVGAVGWLVYEIAELFGMEAFAASLLAVIPLTDVYKRQDHGLPGSFQHD